MIVYYAPGGGLGHLTRGIGWAHTNGIEPGDITFISSHNDLPVYFHSINHIGIPEDLHEQTWKLHSWLPEMLEKLATKRLIVDTFPGGIIGELLDYDKKGIETEYVARRLKWEEYKKFSKNISFLFDRTYICENLHLQQLRFIEKHSRSQVNCEILYPVQTVPEPLISEIKSLEKPFWLVVHSGNEDEVSALCEMALEQAENESIAPEIWLISEKNVPMPGIRSIQYYPAWSLFPFAGKIFTAGGFNSIQQAFSFREKHFVLPFVRKYDDQFLRCRNYVNLN